MIVHFLQKSRSDEVELSLVPLIDVVLVILIFLSVTTTFSPVGQLAIDLPDSDARENDLPPNTLHLVIARDGAVSIDGEAVPGGDGEAIRAALVRRVPANERPIVVIEADAATPHQRVIDALRAAQAAGLPQVTFAVETHAR